MSRKIPLILGACSLLALALAPPASALGIASHRALRHGPPARSSDSSGGTLLAPTGTCPGEEDLDAPAEAQQEAMRCMTEFARARVGLNQLADSPQLDLSAQQKSADVIQCDSFSHEACGREFTYWMRQDGYLSSSCWHVGENLAWGTGEYATVRSIFRAWMRSPEHRRNILGAYAELGVSLATGELEGQAETHVWTEHFGSRC